MTRHKGGCHCGRVTFEIEAPENLEVVDCNCSICRMTGFLHVFVSKSNFELSSGEGDLDTYVFSTGVAKHYFCRHCGIKSFYVPRSHPDGYSVNANCLDESTIASISIEPFDGRNWEQNASKLSPLSD